jgi:hypothetical protein
MGGERTRPPSPPLLFLTFGAGRFATRLHRECRFGIVGDDPEVSHTGSWGAACHFDPLGALCAVSQRACRCKRFQRRAPNIAGLSMGARDKRAGDDQGGKEIRIQDEALYQPSIMATRRPLKMYPEKGGSHSRLAERRCWGE